MNFFSPTLICILYRPGSSNHEADRLSRIPVLSPTLDNSLFLGEIKTMQENAVQQLKLILSQKNFSKSSASLACTVFHTYRSRCHLLFKSIQKDNYV